MEKMKEEDLFMKNLKFTTLVITSLAGLTLLTACGNNATANKDTSNTSSSSVSTSDSSSSTVESSSSVEQSTTPSSSSSTSESSTGSVDNSNNPITNNGAGGHSSQTENGVKNNWLLIYADKAGVEHDGIVSSSFEEVQAAGEQMLKSGQAVSYRFVQQ
jgi:cytoskeletal protein RodZ